MHMARTRIKICGVKTPEIALAAVEAGVDALGFVFAKGSPRTIDPEQAWEIVTFLPPFISKVGLMVNPSLEEFDTIREAFPFDFAQLHGLESESLVSDCGPWIIKAIRFNSATIEEDLRRWSLVDDVDALLIDGSSGGQGDTLDWETLARVKDACDHPLILAGGLTPKNVGEAIRIVRPFAVDVSSGVEIERGVKDPALMVEFCQAVREADARLGR